jgi:hypothetical protein
MLEHDQARHPSRLLAGCSPHPLLTLWFMGVTQARKCLMYSLHLSALLVQRGTHRPPIM